MSFLKTTLLGGLFLLLPIMLLWVGLQEIGGLLVAMATPIADMLPGKIFEDLLAPGVVALVLIVAASFVLGLAAKATWLCNLGRKFESSVLYKVPMYRMLKVISGALVDPDNSHVDAALVKDETGGGDPCYVMGKTRGRACDSTSSVVTGIVRRQHQGCAAVETGNSSLLTGRILSLTQSNRCWGGGVYDHTAT